MVTEKKKIDFKTSFDDLQKFDCCAGWSGNKDIFYMKDNTIIKKVKIPKKTRLNIYLISI